MKMLLFGDKGQIGREVADLANLVGIEVRGYDIDTVDITNEERLRLVFTAEQADIVINAAAYTAVDKAEDEVVQAFKVNCIGVQNLAVNCKQYDLPLLHISTDYVFSGDSSSPYTENDIPQPLNVYGQSKLKGEQELAKIWSKHIILRVSWVFGKYGNNFVKTILRLAQARDSLSIVSDQVGSPTAAADIARVLLEMAVQICENKKNSWGIYNYCNYPATSWYDFACRIVEIGRAKHNLKLVELHKIATADYPTKAVRPKNSELAVKKIITDYDIECCSWLEHLRSAIDEIVL